MSWVDFCCGFGLGIIVGAIFTVLGGMLMPDKETVNSLDALQALKFFLTKERKRHEQDIVAINKDILKLNGIEIPPGLSLDTWYEVPKKHDKTRKV